MKSLWIVLALVATFGVYAKAQADDYDDYFNYDDLEDLEKMLEEDTNDKPVNEKTDIENDLKVEEEIQQFREADEDKAEAEDDAKDYKDADELPLDTLSRLKLLKGETDGNDFRLDNDDNLEPVDGDSIEDDGKNLEDIIENRPEPDDPNAPSKNEDYALLWGDDSVAPLPVPETAEEDENKALFEETKQILEEQDADDFEEDIKKAFEKNVEAAPEDQPKMEQIIEETKQLLAESDNSFVEDNKQNVEGGSIEADADDSNKAKLDNVEDKIEDDDTVDKAYADLNADLDKLFETLDKLKSDVSDNSDDTKALDEDQTAIKDNEGENVNNKKEISDLDNTDIEEALKEVDKYFENNNFDNYDTDASEEVAEDNKDDDVDLDKLLENILSEDDFKAEDSAAEVFEPFLNDAINEPNPDDAAEKDVESLDSAIRYLNDALVNDEPENAETLENSDDSKDDKKPKEDASVEKDTEVKTILVDELTSSERQDLVSQFSILHSEDLDVHSDTFESEVAPVHITLKLDEPTVIRSPNYPDKYPTNNVVDWILEGPGIGIELNITDFAVNGALGDFLLIKPGGTDDSGHDSLLFTYRLTNERRYRFMDVDRLFMRFESKPGIMFFNGFSLSAKMMAPLPSDPEPIPEPEAVVTPPHSTATVTLAVRVPHFDDIKENFRQVIADMADQYIADYGVDAGVNSTSEVTHITHVGLCPVTWPNYEGCTAVTFGVSLVYEDAGHDPRLNEEDLKTMWTVYSRRDPFALRLMAMGVSEFNGPDDGVLTAWLLIAGGVVLSMAVLAFVLWRYSCFEDYTRMKAYSDTDSIHNEKRNLDLYPTPHQNLPPLYAEQEYKWPEEDATRVDMGGFANRSYARDNMYDFDSDEDVIATRDRQGAVTAKDFSNV